MDTQDTTDRGVTGIISAFRTSLQEFRNYREHRRKSKKSTSRSRPTKSPKGKDDESNVAELRLSRSLIQGAVDVQSEYEKHYRAYGDKYAVGDTTAHSSLRRTLRKLNTCFQNIFAAILKKEPRIDYQYLTSVSDVSRQEALDALGQLSHRMSRSASSVHDQKQVDRHKRKKSNSDSPKLPSSKSISDMTELSGSRKGQQRKKQPEVRMVHLKSASTPQLAMVRPKPRRSSSSSKSEISTTPPQLPSPIPTSPTRKQHKRHDSGVEIQYVLPSITIPTPPPPPAVPSVILPPPSPTRRRQDKITPSMYTFASASTRLGEIPELKWSIPYDHDAMSRLNREHGGRPWPPPPEPTKPRRGFLSLFKKSDLKTAEVAA